MVVEWKKCPARYVVRLAMQTRYNKGIINNWELFVPIILMIINVRAEACSNILVRDLSLSVCLGIISSKEL
jgi:hypothetical protein